MVIHFKTSKQKQTDRIVAALERLFVGKPVGSIAIGAACTMEHAQVLKYLHRAKAEGRATPVLSGLGGKTRGWTPAGVTPDDSNAVQNAKRAADAVKQLSTANELVSASQVAALIKVPRKTAAHWLTIAKQMGLVKSKYRRGWMPA